jgi:hypothetical protein
MLVLNFSSTGISSGKAIDYHCFSGLSPVDEKEGLAGVDCRRTLGLPGRGPRLVKATSLNNYL